MIKEENTGQSPQYDQGTLLLWQKHYEHYLHSDRAAVDIGIFVLKVVMVVNAGALIALLATFGQFKDVQEVAGSIAASAYPFFFGLVAAILGAMLSYIYQSLNTAKLLNEFHGHFPKLGEPPPYVWARPLAKVILCIVILLVLASCAFFGYGTWLLISIIADMY